MGLLLILVHLALIALSWEFGAGGGPRGGSILALVGMELLAGSIYLLAVAVLRKEGSSGRATIMFAIAVGALIRLVMLSSFPMLENDFYRYLWDGAVSARGMNPYRFSPAEVLEGGEDGPSIPLALQELASESGPILERVNHPYLRTIYPSVAQAAFAFSHWLAPWSLLAWRNVLLAFDLATLALLILLLQTLKLPALWLVIYWWNPILIKEIYNSGHMDVVALPFVLFAALLTIRGRSSGASASLALAVGTKIWPMVLLPLILRPMGANPRRVLRPLLIFGLMMGVIFLPFCLAGLGEDSGILAYAQHWDMNDALFLVFSKAAQMILPMIGIPVSQAKLVARLFAFALLVLWILKVIRRPLRDPHDFCERALLITAAVFLLSPTQYPWYYLWVLPFLALRPRASLLLLTCLLPIYYLRFYFKVKGGVVSIFDNGIVWLEYIPVWVLLIREGILGRQGHPNKAAAVEAIK